MEGRGEVEGRGRGEGEGEGRGEGWEGVRGEEGRRSGGRMQLSRLTVDGQKNDVTCQ